VGIQRTHQGRNTLEAPIPGAELRLRFFPLTNERPKEMLSVIDRPAIHRVVEVAIVGEGQSGHEDYGWFARLVTRILKNRALTFYGVGKQVPDALHMKDLARAFDAALRFDQAMRGGLFSFGGGGRQHDLTARTRASDEGLTGKQASLAFADWRPGDQKSIFPISYKRSRRSVGHLKSRREEGIRPLTRWYTEEFGAQPPR